MEAVTGLRAQRFELHAAGLVHDARHHLGHGGPYELLLDAAGLDATPSIGIAAGRLVALVIHRVADDVERLI